MILKIEDSAIPLPNNASESGAVLDELFDNFFFLTKHVAMNKTRRKCTWW